MLHVFTINQTPEWKRKRERGMNGRGRQAMRSYDPIDGFRAP